MSTHKRAAPRMVSFLLNAGLVISLCGVAGCVAETGPSEDIGAAEELLRGSELGTLPTPLGPHGGTGGGFSHCSGDMIGDGFASLGTVYYPAPIGRRCGTSFADLDVILVRRAVGSTNSWYWPLGEHLASHGYVVALLDSNDLDGAMDYLHHRFPLTGRVGLFGHSRGGLRVATRVAEVESGGDDVRAVVLLNPIVDHDEGVIETSDLDLVDGFLAIHSVSDADPGTWGELVPGDSRNSVWRTADRVADRRVVGDVDLIFVPGTHYIQSERVTLGYATAFFDAHVRGSLANRAYFAVQTPMHNLSSTWRPVSQFHRQLPEFIVADHENSLQPTPGPGMTIEGAGETYDLDDFSPHDTSAIRVRRVPSRSSPALHYDLPSPISTYGSRYLSFRASQIYDPSAFPSGAPVEMSVEACSATVCSTIRVGSLPFPIVENPLSLAQMEGSVDATKNGMRTFLIRMSEFADEHVDLSGLTRLSIVFESGPTQDFMVDDVELISPFSP